MTTARIEARFAALKNGNRAGLIPFIMAGDPDAATTAQLLAGLPAAGADLIELGMPFSDPMADGPAIQAAGVRALKGGMTLAGVLDLARGFRASDDTTPLILMGYLNPIEQYGNARFIADAVAAGVDGLIIVDAPPECDAELGAPARAAGLAFVRLATPTTDDARLPAVLQGAAGFLYHVAVAGITGSASAAVSDVAAALARYRAHSGLPVAVGFGIKTAADVKAMAAHADAVVVGSSIVKHIEAGLDESGRAGRMLVPDTLAFVKGLAQGTAR